MLDDAAPEQKFKRIALNVPGTKDDLFPVYAFAEDATGNLWIGHERGLTKRNLTSGESVTYSVSGKPDNETDTVFSLAIDDQQRI